MNEFILSSEILTEFELESPKEYKIKAIVLLVENNRLNEGYSLNMLGKQMKDWVKDAISHFDCRFVSLAEKDNPLEVIKPFITDEDITIVLFSDIPLLTSNTILDILDLSALPTVPSPYIFPLVNKSPLTIKVNCTSFI